MHRLKTAIVRKVEFTVFMLVLVVLDAVFVIAAMAIGRMVAEADKFIWGTAHNGFFETMETVSSTICCILYAFFVLLTLLISATYLKDEIKELLKKG